MLLKDKIALVTGSTHNIGLGIARAFAREGAKVVVHSRHEEDARKIATEIDGDFFAADMANTGAVAAMFDHVKNKHGRLDILVNSVAHSAKAGMLETSLEEWNRILTINLTGYFLCIQHAGKHDERARRRQHHQYLRGIRGALESGRRRIFDLERRDQFTHAPGRGRSRANDSRQWSHLRVWSARPSVPKTWATASRNMT